MDILLQLLPGEHVAAFPARFYDLGLLDQPKTCEYLRVPTSIFDAKAQHLLCVNQHNAISIHATQNNYREIWGSNGFGQLIASFITSNEAALIDKKPSSLHSTRLCGQISIRENRWRWCQKCAEENQEEFGTSYYHRDHQIPCVFHCHKHKTPLSSNCTQCGFIVRSTVRTPRPIRSNVCPRCGGNIHSDLFYYDETMEIIEHKILEFVKSGSDYKFKDLTKHVRNFIGLDITGPVTVSHNRKLGEWKKFINSFLMPKARDTLFKKGRGKDQVSMADALLTKSRIYNEDCEGEILHPLLHLIALKATEHEMFR